MKQKVTIKEVAKHAGVSASTVSRVVSNKGKISKKTTDRVFESIRILGYVPNYTARSLAKSNTDTIAVVVDRSPKSLNNSYFTDVLQAIAKELNLYSKELLLIFNEENVDERDRIRSLVESNRIDGVIKLSVKENDLSVDYLSENDIPAVVIGNPEKKSKILWVDNDNEQAMYEVVHSLLNKNKKKLCFIGGPNKFIVTRDRLRGFKKAHEDFGISVRKSDIYQMEFFEEDAYKNAEDILNKDYDAIVCTDDSIALGIQKKALSLGKDICITGFNNSREVQFSANPFPTVDISIDKLGRWAVKLLIAKINGDKTVTNKIIKTRYIELRE
ncbi:MAG: LacI family DNA-binding transcriptional regulator [Tissierellia bacterium]|nr:LacI family DNA-binding transcriptional regulator [Tissierellia bacterium]